MYSVHAFCSHFIGICINWAANNRKLVFTWCHSESMHSQIRAGIGTQGYLQRHQVFCLFGSTILRMCSLPFCLLLPDCVTGRKGWRILQPNLFLLIRKGQSFLRNSAQENWLWPVLSVSDSSWRVRGRRWPLGSVTLSATVSECFYYLSHF